MGILTKFDHENVLYYFEEITKIPHGSGNEFALSNYITSVAKQHGLYVRQDKLGNVVLKKPATSGYETIPAVILQGHLDMVCEKLGNHTHDFTTDSLELEIDGDFIHAKNTTLGADDGIAVAYILALMTNDTLSHPALEAILTVQEETGMDGAREIDVSDIEGKYFINLDTEEEGQFLIGCCGGRRVHIKLPLNWIETTQKGYLLKISGLMGGHSGSDIHLGRANAHKLIVRIVRMLKNANISFSLAGINGGTMDNAICREAEAILVFDQENEEEAYTIVKTCAKRINEEYEGIESDIQITLQPLHETISLTWNDTTTNHAIELLHMLPYGVASMSSDISGLVQTSNNIGIIRTTSDTLQFEISVRSAIKEEKETLCKKIETLAHLWNATVEESNDYPGWMNTDHSAFMELLRNTYEEVTGKHSCVTAIHAGVECGLFSEKLPHLDMVSIGPEMYDVHTPQERLSISSTLRVWAFLKEALRRMK